LETVDRVRELEDKPDAKLLSGLWLRAMIEAQATTGQSSGDAYEAAFGRNYAQALKPLPWAIVANRIKEEKTGDELRSRDLVLGGIQASIEPAVAKSHELSNDLAWQLIGDRLLLSRVLPLEKASLEVLTKYVAEHNVQKPDIWEARDVTLTDADKLTPVRVAIWDSGSDLALFAGRVFTDSRAASAEDTHDIAFDLKGLPAHGYLYPLDAQRKDEYPEMRAEMKDFSDLQLSIDSPEATAVRKKIAGMPSVQVPAYIEELNFFGIYAHGTHVAGIAARGNPAIRLAVGRLTFDWHNVPLAPSESSRGDRPRTTRRM
jgi:hypothetical protein